MLDNKNIWRVLVVVTLLITTGLAHATESQPLAQFSPAPAPLKQPAINAARGLLARLDPTASLQTATLERDIAVRFNALTHAYCRSEQPHTGRTNINELFDRCATACGGYSYVLKGLLATRGIPSRYINLYNMPNQGNHTAVEALIEGRWVFLDPTFGLYFTLDGSPTGAIATLHDVRFKLPTSQLAKHVSILKERKISSVVRQPNLIVRSGEIDNPYMYLENYHRAMRIASEGFNSILPLTLTMSLDQGSALFGAQHNEWQQPTDAEATFLTATNATLLDDDKNNDVSFHYSYAGSNGQLYESLTVLNLTNLNPGDAYEVKISGYSKASDGILQAAEIGGSVFFSSNPMWALPKGKWEISTIFRTKTERAQLIFSRRDQTPSFARIFGISASSTQRPSAAPRLAIPK